MYDEDLANLDEWLRRLKVEYDIFFNGHRKKPPEDLRMRVERVVKRLSEASNMSFAERFRYNTLVTRFYVFRDLWRRTLQEREAGRVQDQRPDEERTDIAAADAGAVETICVSISDPEAEVEKVQQLYDALLRMKGKHATGVSYPQFAKYISMQTRGIRDKYQCSNVTFTVTLEENAIKFTATAQGRDEG